MIATTQQNVSTDLDLGSMGGPPRNWKGIGIAMVVILAVLSLVTLSIMLLTPDETHLLHQSHLTVEDLESDKFQTHDPCVTWLNEDEVVLCSREGHVIKHDLRTNQTATLLDNSTFDLKAAKFQVSADQRFVLLAYNIRQVFSQSFTASYTIYSVATGDIVELAAPGKDASVLQFAAWGPQGNQLIYVFENDIYYRTDVSSNTLRLTYTGREGLVVSGLTDWVYEEEVLLTYQAHWWSEDGARLAYLTINNSATPFMEIPHFLGEVYPSPLFFAYPKAGANIPAVSLHVVNLYGPAHTLEMVPPDSFSSRSHYISMVTWIGSTQLAVRWVNRPQNQSALSVCEATTGACSEKHKLPVDIWQDQLQEVPLFSKDASTFYLTLPAKQGARGEFRHVASLQAQPPVPSAPPRFLTSGNWDVSSLCALDEQSGKMYKAPNYAVVVAMYWGLALAYYRPAAPLQMSGYAELINQYFLSSEMSRQSRHLYSVDLSGVLQRQCLTCNLIENCSFLKAEFSPNRTRFTLHCLGPGIPKVTVHSTKEPHRYIVLEDNKPMSQAMEGKWLPEMQFRTLSGENYDLHLKLCLPQTHEENVHPLLIIVDGTPGSYTVTEEFSLGWPQVLSSTHGVVVAWIDNRSSATRGQKSTTHDARKLSPLMVKDQLGVVEWLMQLPFIDNRRMALYGKAFGGYMALKMLAATDQLFKCAAVMAPITDFRFYSAAFSERYFGLPSKDESAYVAASVLEDAERLKHENFLILHGTSDARVHFQHSAELLSRLVRVEANYTLQLYPDEGHSLRAERSQQHFRRTLGHFLQACLIQAPPRRESAANQEDDY